MKRLKHLFFFLLSMLLITILFLVATNHWTISANSLSNDTISQSSNIFCPTPTPLSSPTPVYLAARAETTSASSPCSYLPIIQHHIHDTVCPTATPEPAPTISGSTPTPVGQAANNMGTLNSSCVTATPWPTPINGTSTPVP